MWSLDFSMSRSWERDTEGAQEWVGGALEAKWSGRSTLVGEDQNRAENRQWRWTNNGRPSTRVWEGKTWERNHYGVILIGGNVVIQDQWRYAWGRRIQGNGVSNEMAGGVEFASQHLTSSRGDQRDFRLRFAPYGRAKLGSGFFRTRNSPEAFTCYGDWVTRYGRRRQRVDTEEVFPLSGGTRRDEGLIKCRTLDQTW